MDYFYSVLIGLGISIILWLSPIIAGVFGRFVYFFYIGIALGIASWNFNYPKFPYIIISIISAFLISNINAKHAKNGALSKAPEQASGSMVWFILFIIIGSIYHLIIK